jgi:RNA polymerase sigma factor (TIGR02999 family)
MKEEPSLQITRLLQEWQQGNTAAGEEVFRLVYDELRKIAARKMRNERPGHVLQATALVNEAYQVLSNQHATWQNRRQFYGIAAQVMQRILLDEAKAQKRNKRGGNAIRIDIENLDLRVETNIEEQLELEEQLHELKKDDAVAHEIFMLRYYGGRDIAEIASALNVSNSTVNRNLRYAKAWLRREIGRKFSESNDPARNK